MSARPRFEERSAALKFLRRACVSLSLLLLLGAAHAGGGRGQIKELPRQPRPARILTIQGQVSLPEGMPVGRALVTMTSRDGVPRQTYTTEQGRFEFPETPEGDYVLTARSIGDSPLVSDNVETDTNRTATGTLSVNLILHREVEGGRRSPRPEVVSVAEADQKVPKEARSAFRKGLKYRSINEPAKALESFSRAVELYPDYFQALAERGDLLIFQRKLAEAAADFDRALKISARYAPALRGAGYCKLERREFAAAVQDFEKSIATQPDNPNAHLLLGIAYLELDRRELARAALFKALSFNSPHELRAHIYLGNLFARERLFKEAADELRKYLEANPKAPDAPAIKAIEAQWRAAAAP